VRGWLANLKKHWVLLSGIPLGVVLSLGRQHGWWGAHETAWTGAIVGTYMTLLAAVAVHRIRVMVIESRRFHAGRCPACNYDREGIQLDAACPECGAPGPFKKAP
jgi:hypothetical protein